MTTLTNRIALGLATFGIVGLLGASPAQAAQPQAGNKDRSEAKAGRMCARLACSATQKAKIQQIKARTGTPQQKAARDSLRKLQTQVRAELGKPSPDARAIERLDAQIAAQKAALHGQRRAAQLQILAVLDAGQRAKFLAKGDKRHGKGKHGKGGKRQRG